MTKTLRDRGISHPGTDNNVRETLVNADCSRINNRGNVFILAGSLTLIDDPGMREVYRGSSCSWNIFIPKGKTDA